MSLLEKAIAIAVKAHRGTRDKSGLPYILHPLRMMCRLQTEDEQIVAILHDVVEDTDWTFKDLAREGFPKRIIEPLKCLTKREGEPYDEFVQRAASHPVARRVKLADLEDNMDVRRIGPVGPKDAARLSKYVRAWNTLTKGKKHHAPTPRHQ
jgi:(p)ppGpp synthase/HD superfamily hydrolase